MGLSSAHAGQLARSGWLTRLGQGVYKLPQGELDRDKALALLAKHIKGLHVGSKTALAWRGIRHNITFEERLMLWGEKGKQLPPWFQSHFKATYQSTNIFSDSLPPNFGLAPLPGGHPDVLVSVPERALLELFSDTGKSQFFEETMHLAEGTHNLRLDVLDTLLTHTTRIKVARFANMVAREYSLPWQAVAKKHSARLGKQTRWIALSSNQARICIKP
ncbi:MAG: type IV toxin-antitoxin system AbiEi family antitoxin [Burkholderiaceae bacterium]|nr:type IV toxin-antitoxin system AbiEi family antitoxin [Burkholderiaceae bacterium]MCD8538289.1 type IV toxin-antitoxin system AbiEi family antitoxin [Burkholderiaceae bacterium]MCD8565372.1 type IV toxin-antitoxin system AbiEi family antitoxin [Burkholderiaceae bacterium]